MSSEHILIRLLLQYQLPPKSHSCDSFSEFFIKQSCSVSKKATVLDEQLHPVVEEQGLYLILRTKQIISWKDNVLH